MNLKYSLNIYIVLFLVLFSLNAHSADKKSPLNTITGDIKFNGQPIPFATIHVKSTTIGTTSNENGEFKLSVPSGNQMLIAKALGYKSHEIQIDHNSLNNIQITLEEDPLLLDQVVVTADKNERKRKESSLVVNTLNFDFFNTTQSNTLSEGLAFLPGLRVENTCGNCGSNQVRMNGLDGPYSQILVNGKSIFSGLASVYGLELIPSNMIERVEVVRGGGSALYGSNAIAGTINIITKEPLYNNYEVEAYTSLIGINNNPKPESQLNFNTTISSDDKKQNFAIYGSLKDRTPYDANNDGFSELSKISSSMVGMHYSLKPTTKTKISADYFFINEDRRGGDSFDLPVHETLITEATEHKINSFNVSYLYFPLANHELQFFGAGQTVNRDSYYGASKALDAYGKTNDATYNTGVNYKYILAKSSLISGAEVNGGNLRDKKLGYRTYEYNDVSDEIDEIFHPNKEVANQDHIVYSVFGQYEQKIKSFSASVGTRYDYYSIENTLSESPKQANSVLSPRVNLLYGIDKDFQLRASYSKGYRSPQIFDEDLHVETSEARQIIHVNSPDLTQETSNSYMSSISYQHSHDNHSIELLSEFFLTQLNNPFSTEIGAPDENGTVIYKRVNEKEGAIVKGVNFEVNALLTRHWKVNGSYTIQSSKYGAPQDFDETRFLRTPDQYGYMKIEWLPTNKFSLNATGVYTGKMLVPYFGPLIAIPEDGILKESPNFIDLGLNATYNIKTKVGKLQVKTGIKNILNSYQTDIDTGGDRDPGYVYGPKMPQTVYLSLKMSDIF